MLTFFRRIRRSLLGSGATRKYLLYAIGEISLVVFGILIALQINNWNEERKQRSAERNLLVELHTNLEACLEELSGDMSFNKLTIQKYMQLRSVVNHDLPYSQDLDSAFVMIHDWESPYLTFTAYEVLKSNGVELIQNDKLRMSVVNLYEYVFVNLIDDYDRTEWNYHQSVVMPFTSRYLEQNILNYGAKPNDFEELKKITEFTNVLSNLISMRQWGLKVLQITLDETENVLKLIEQELNQSQ